MKNKYQEALDYLKGGNLFGELSNDSLEGIEELVDKETPMKPYKDGKKYKCSRCKLQRVSSRYCADCGQKIDWSNEE